MPHEKRVVARAHWSNAHTYEIHYTNGVTAYVSAIVEHGIAASRIKSVSLVAKGTILFLFRLVSNDQGGMRYTIAPEFREIDKRLAASFLRSALEYCKDKQEESRAKRTKLSRDIKNALRMFEASNFESGIKQLESGGCQR